MGGSSAEKGFTTFREPTSCTCDSASTKPLSPLPMRWPSAGLTTTTLSPSMPCPCRFVSTATRISFEWGFRKLVRVAGIH